MVHLVTDFISCNVRLWLCGFAPPPLFTQNKKEKNVPFLLDLSY